LSPSITKSSIYIHKETVILRANWQNRNILLVFSLFIGFCLLIFSASGTKNPKITCGKTGPGLKCPFQI